jgi:putative oxidoreductase
MKYVVLIGRILFSAIFVASSFGHFKSETIQHAAEHGVMMPNLLVPASGLIALLGGISIVLGFKAKFGAWLIVAFLVPVTLTMHNFWSITDPQQHQMQMIMFMKNLSMLGGAFLITYFGAGPLSIDNRKSNSQT